MGHVPHFLSYIIISYKGDEVNFIVNIFYELTKLNIIERCDCHGQRKE